MSEKIIVLGRYSVKNYGDPIIADCLEYLLKTRAEKLGLKTKVCRFDIFKKIKFLSKLFLNSADKLVFAGGGLNSIKVNNILTDIFSKINKKNQKIYYNAVGILTTENRNENINLLKDLFNRENVRQVTTRGNFEKCCEYVENPHFPTTLILDPAMWVPYAYDIKKKDSDIVGVGLIRPEIFEHNGKPFTVEDTKNMYKNLVSELDKRNIKWQFFINGAGCDYKFAKEILKELGLSEDSFAYPKNKRELIEIISSYKGIIAARLHANIIATSLEIPSVGLVWDEKMRWFSEIIGVSDRYIDADKLSDTTLIVNTLEDALSKGFDNQRIDEFRKITLKTIDNILLDK